MAGLQGAPAPAPAVDTGAGWRCRTLATPSVIPPELSRPALAPPLAAPQVVIEVKKEMDASLAVLTQARVPTFTFPRHKSTRMHAHGRRLGPMLFLVAEAGRK